MSITSKPYFASLITLLALSAPGQNLAVLWYGSNTNAETVGIPYYWPAQKQPIGTGTNVPSGFVLLTQPQLDTITATNQAAYDAWASNKNFVASSNIASNYAAAYAMYLQIPQGITDSSNRIGTFTNMAVVLNGLRSAWQSGTNTAAGTNNIISALLTNMVLMANQGTIDWTYHNQVIVFLSRIGPSIFPFYRPELDQVGH